VPWNAALAGRPPVPDDVAAAARHIRDDAQYRRWYSIDLGDTPWPADVLLCQRQSTIWNRRDPRAYGIVLIAGVMWFLVGLTVAIARDLSLAAYLIKTFLPSAPEFLDALDLARQHWHHAAAREQLQDKIDDLWKAYASRPASLAITDCREIQDSAYLFRRDGPRVPTAIYKLRKQTSEAIMRAGTASLRAEGHGPR
jgi:hypothetical protein